MTGTSSCRWPAFDVRQVDLALQCVADSLLRFERFSLALPRDLLAVGRARPEVDVQHAHEVRLVQVLDVVDKREIDFAAQPCQVRDHVVAARLELVHPW